MNDPRNSQEVRRLRSLLQRMADLADHVEQTGSFEAGARNSIRRYNSIVERLEELEAISEDTFPKLDDNTGFGELGAECTLLADYLKDLEEPALDSRAPQHKLDMSMIPALAPFLDREDVRKMVRANLSGHGKVDPDIVISLAPFLGREELGRIIREHMPEWFEGGSRRDRKPADKEESGKSEGAFDWLGGAFDAEADARGAAQTAPSETETRTEEQVRGDAESGMEANAVEERLAEVSAKLQDAAEQLRHRDLTDERRVELSEQLAALSQLQARLARQQAALRNMM